ncbi:hypothetical protein C2845_PM15G14960 [Panicum miliaceum]|uniref:Wall-associated receptor kinase galacturonan-binding domain-containing protein n=1 Tax=Panicum miliaceum TaxID=4540 RepID=A0A3L6Q9V2_PANMI|nr:hypothetical protein C2845_PM15G14960 [Panicum miliaceum]
MATLVLGLLSVPSPTAVAVKTSGRNCSTYRGGHEIPYPFGIGPECSLPGFNLTCEVGAHNTSYILLGNQSIWVRSISVFPHYFPILPAIETSIGYMVKMAPGVRDKSIHWEAPGRPFALPASSNMSLFVVGCGVKASLFVGDTDVEVGNCSVICVEDEIMERLPKGLCIGIGCCHINITVDLRAFTLDISRTGRASRLYGQFNAFITGNGWPWFNHPSNPPPTTLSWSIPNEPNCTRAMEDRANYACVSNHSYCLESPIGGYACACVEGFSGNPYVFNGCMAIGLSGDNDEVPEIMDSIISQHVPFPTACSTELP